MKCLCGYEGEDFMRLGVESPVLTESCIFECEDQVVYVFVCPECGTLKINIKKEG